MQIPANCALLARTAQIPSIAQALSGCGGTSHISFASRPVSVNGNSISAHQWPCGIPFRHLRPWSPDAPRYLAVLLLSRTPQSLLIFKFVSIVIDRSIPLRVISHVGLLRMFSLAIACSWDWLIHSIRMAGLGQENRKPKYPLLACSGYTFWALNYPVNHSFRPLCSAKVL